MLEVLAVHDVLPVRISRTLIEGGDLVQDIEIDVGGLDECMARHLSLRLEQFPSVRMVPMSRHLPVAAVA